MPPDHLSLRRASRASKADVSLTELMARVADGDEAAFVALYDQVAPAVYGLARRVVRGAEQAEEVAQEALLEVWRTATRFDSSRGTPMTYVLTLTHRRAVDLVRREQSAKNREQRAAVAADTAYDVVDETVTGRLESQQVRECLEALTALQREAVTLAYYDGHTYPEVAALLGVNPSTVKTRMRDGLLRLKDCLGVRW
jgi:RNA polymerase sigma-70 factor (ECF subfamily)